MSRMVKRSLSSIVDQAMLSGLNFGMGVFLIRHVAKDVYGTYVQLFALGVLLCGVIDALVGNAIANLSSRTTEEDMPAVLARMQALARTVGTGLGLVSAVGMLVVLSGRVAWPDLLLQSLVFGLYITALTFRDFKRVSLYLRKRGEDVLRLDGLYVGLTALGGFGVYALEGLGISSIFLVMTAANVLAVALSPNLVDTQAPIQLTMLRSTFSTCWQITHWALPGVVVGWASNSSYLFITGLTLGPQVTAELNASRLLLMPLTLIVTAWYQMARADVASVVGQGSAASLRRFLRKSALIIFVPSFAYLAVLAAGYPLIKGVVVRPDYTHFDSLLLTWLAYFLVYAVKFVGMGLLVGFEAYKPMFKLSLATTAIQMGAVYALTLGGHAPSAIHVLIFTECLELCTMWFVLLPRYLKRLKVSPA